MDKLAAARYFLTVAQTGSFTKAAHRLHVPVSTVSRRIKDLEAYLGVKLLTRTTRFLTLTEVGEAYFRHVEGAVRAFEDAEDVVRQAADSPSGTIRISGLPSYSELYLYPLIDEFRRLYPEIVVDLNTTDHVQDLVRERYDFAIRPTSKPPDNLVARVIDMHRMMLVAAPAYVERMGKIANHRETVNHKALCYRGLNGIMPWYGFSAGEWHLVEKVPSFLCNDTNELLRVAIAGEGVALLPEWTAKRAMADGLVEMVNVGWDVSFVGDFDHRLYLLYEKSSTDLHRNRLFLEFLLDKIEVV